MQCKRQTSVASGTLFHKSHKPLRTWLLAMWFVSSQKHGASALGLKRVLGLGSYNTAWTWLHKLRRTMVRPGRDQLTGAIEIVEILLMWLCFVLIVLHLCWTVGGLGFIKGLSVGVSIKKQATILAPIISRQQLSFPSGTSFGKVMGMVVVLMAA